MIAPWSHRKLSHSRAIILFDGVCNLCNSSVNYIVDHDPRRQFQFASQQSPAGQRLLREMGLRITDEPQSIVLIEGGRYHTRSQAALRIARRLSGTVRVASLGIALPAFVRDAAYDFIARNRYRWFGRLEACRMPSPDMAGRFLNR